MPRKKSNYQKPERSELEAFEGGKYALLRAMQPLTPKTLSQAPRPITIQLKAGDELKALIEELSKEYNVDQSKLIRWLIYRFDAERRAKHGEA